MVTTRPHETALNPELACVGGKGNAIPPKNRLHFHHGATLRASTQASSRLMLPIVPIGTRTLPNLHLLDFRAEKTVRLASHQTGGSPGHLQHAEHQHGHVGYAAIGSDLRPADGHCP